MGPVQAIRTCLTKFFRWRGRASRSEFWWFFLFYYGGIFVYIFVTTATRSTITEEQIGPLIIFVLIFVLPFLAVLARRLHDKGLTAWLILLSMVPFGQVALLILAALPGDKGANGYGPDPLEPDEAQAYSRSRIPVVKDDDQ